MRDEKNDPKDLDSDSSVSDLLSNSLEFSEEEKTEVTQEINDLMVANKLSVTADRLQPQSSKSGLFVPLLIMGALLLTAGIFVIISYGVFNDRQESQLTRSRQSYSSQLVREILYQANTRIEEKEAEIERIRDQLLLVESDLGVLEEDINAEIDNRRIELEQQFDEEYAKREQELLDSQYSPEEVQRLLEEYRIQAEQEIANELNLLRNNATDRIAQREMELIRVQENLVRSLAQQEGEVAALQRQVVEQSQSLGEQLSTPELNLSEVESRLQRFRIDDGRRNALEEQISAGIALAITNANSNEPLTNLAQLRTILAASETSQLLGSARTSLELQVLEVIENYSRLRQRSLTGADDTQLVETSPEAIAALQLVEQLRARYQSTTSALQQGSVPSDVQGLESARNELLASIIAAEEIFPDFGPLFFALDDQLLAASRSATAASSEAIAALQLVEQLRARYQSTTSALQQGSVPSDVQGLESARNELLASIIAAEEIFPDFGPLFFALDDQLLAASRSATAASPEAAAALQLVEQLRARYQSTTSALQQGSVPSDVQGLESARNELLASIIAAEEIFPGFGPLFFALDDQLLAASRSAGPVVSTQQTAASIRTQAFSDAEIAVGAALGNIEALNEVRRLLQSDQQVARLYSFVGSSLNDDERDPLLQQKYNNLLSEWIRQQERTSNIRQNLITTTNEYNDYLETTEVELKIEKNSKLTAWSIAGITGGAALLVTGVALLLSFLPNL